MKSDKYNILFLSSWYPSKKFSFKGDFVKRHAKAISLYANVFVLHVINDKDLKVKYRFVENSDENLFEILCYFNSKWFNRFSYIFYYLKGYKYICKKIGKPDLIHANVLYPIGTVVFILSKLYRIPYIFTEHWTGFLNGTYNRFSRIKTKIFNNIGKKAKYILPVTIDLKEAMIRSGIKGQFIVIPNVVETESFKLKDDTEKQNKKLILHVSNIRDEHKNISGLLRVIAQLKLIRQDFILNIIHSEENELLIDLADSLGVKESFVNFCGKKIYHEVAEYMSKSAFLVLFSNYENLPCVIGESLASGLPVLSTDVGGIKEHLNSNMGILIQKGDEIALLDKMNFMLEHYQEFNKNELRNYAVSHFSYKIVGLEYYNIYKSIINV